MLVSKYPTDLGLNFVGQQMARSVPLPLPIDSRVYPYKGASQAGQVELPSHSCDMASKMSAKNQSQPHARGIGDAGHEAFFVIRQVSSSIIFSPVLFGSHASARIASACCIWILRRAGTASLVLLTGRMVLAASQFCARFRRSVRMRTFQGNAQFL